MRKDTVFFELCKLLEEVSIKSTESEIVLVRQKLKDYVNNDKDKYLQIKAEADFEPNATDSLGYVFSLLGFAVAALAFLFTVFSEFDKILMAFVVAVALIIELCVALRMLNKQKIVNKWRKYILAVINEFNPEQITE